jgi:hypothetical protein
MSDIAAALVVILNNLLIKTIKKMLFALICRIHF